MHGDRVHAQRKPGRTAEPEARQGARAPQSAPAASLPGRMLAVQRSAGNRAATALADSERGVIRRKGDKDKPATDKAAKPKARALTKRSRLAGKLESLIEKAEVETGKHEKDYEHEQKVGPDDMREVAGQLFAEDPAYYCQWMTYKLKKHKGRPARMRELGLSMPTPTHFPLFKYVWDKREGQAVAFLAKTGWDADTAQVKKMALDAPDFFVEHFLLNGLRGRDADKQLLQKLVEEKTFLGQIKAAAPAAYDKLAADIPVLNLVQGVESEVDAKAKMDGRPVPVQGVVDLLFDAFIKNRGMEVAYSGTKVDENLIMLTGQTDADRVYRDTKLKPIMPDIPAKLSTACHQLLALFQSVLKSYPGLEGLDVKPGDEPTAVLTKKLSTLPGGLIAKTYTGNVFDASGKATGQIFFSGEQQKISKSHSWVVIEGVAYDPVLGTKGNDVAGAINGKFEFNGDTTVATEVGGGGRTLTRDRTKKTSGEHGINAAWVLS